MQALLWAETALIQVHDSVRDITALVLSAGTSRHRIRTLTICAMRAKVFVRLIKELFDVIQGPVMHISLDMRRELREKSCCIQS